MKNKKKNKNEFLVENPTNSIGDGVVERFSIHVYQVIYTTFITLYISSFSCHHDDTSILYKLKIK